MLGKTDLSELLAEMKPKLQNGDYVFVSLPNMLKIDFSEVIATFKEKEGTTIILEKEKADALKLKYDYIASWITLKVNSSLAAVGLTAAFSNALAASQISCNVVAAYYHDHIFVAKKDGEKAMLILEELAIKNT
ncbi:ACT domain-containing protein [Croceitalea rosinachiae]|uniref:ACT domain-containing protein n=1 Tax=Croceitalea rosinachiae TaxID=3075596 RepID=A0ABU3A950_9FLAO|nr:ACT domain-containing protein [Croceitalea sp. F388]MDT0606713.1 ACT domain-containing protein [Croceitalea sp. F388]